MRWSKIPTYDATLSLSAKLIIMYVITGVDIVKVSRLLFISLLLLSFDTFAEYSEKQKEELWIVKGQMAVKEKLKDSGSAKFRNLFFNRSKDGIPVTCGEVNSKNSFGAYSGYQRFVSGGSIELTFLEEEVSDGFSKVWKTLCQ
ncbi:TPA: hypothetical protein ACVU5K_004812 [Vibrio parahaemolyticus]